MAEELVDSCFCLRQWVGSGGLLIVSLSCLNYILLIISPPPISRLISIGWTIPPSFKNSKLVVGGYTAQIVRHLPLALLRKPKKEKNYSYFMGLKKERDGF